MDSQAEARARTVDVRRLSPFGAYTPPEQPGPCLEERRGAAMRRLFPKLQSGRSGGRKSDVARQVYGYLAGATTVADLDRRLRFLRRYPTELIGDVRLRDGRAVLVRPVLPTDASMHRAFVQAMSPTTRLHRFHGVVGDVPEPVLRYLTEVDYVDHLALVGEILGECGPRQVAEARWVRRADEPDCADFAIAIADDCQRHGLGNGLVDELQRSAAARGIRRLRGHVLRINRRMRGWLEGRGWRIEPDPHDPGVVCAELTLAPVAARLWREAA